MSTESKTICVIEDNRAISKLFSTLLKKAGYDTFEFNSGSTGLEWLKDNKPLAVICDILLPDINGTELLNKMREIPGGDKWTIVAVTGFAHAYDKDKFIEMGFDGYIAKPINAASFTDDVEAIIEEKRNKN